MAPVLGLRGEHLSISNAGDLREIDAYMIATMVISFMLLSIAILACGCCNGKKGKEKKEKEIDAPRYLEMDVPLGKKDSDEGKQSTTEKNDPKEEAKIRYMELDPPPIVQYKSDTVTSAAVRPAQSNRKTQLSPAPTMETAKCVATTEVKCVTAKALEKSVKESVKMPQSSVKAKEAEPTPALPLTSTVKKPGAGQNPVSPAPVVPKTVPKGDALQFVAENDPRYQSLAQLDDMFEGTMLKATSKGTSAKTAMLGLAKSTRSISAVASKVK